MNRTVKNIAIIVIISSLLGFIYNVFNPSGIPLIREEQKVSYLNEEDLHNPTEGVEAALRAIKVDQAYQLYQQGIQFIDARDDWDFADGHIEGAINIPEFSFEPDNENLKQLDKDYRYVIYCGGDDCDTSKRLASELMKLGFSDIIIFLDGYEVWLNNNYPVEVTNAE